MSANNDKSELVYSFSCSIMSERQSNIEICDEIKKQNLSREKDRFGQTLLHAAAASGNIDVVKYLIKSGSEVNVQDDSGKTAFFMAVESRHSNRQQTLEILLKANANIYITENSGCSAVKFVFNEFYFTDTDVEKFFLNIIHHQECQNNDLLTAEKLLSLKCPLWRAVLLGNEKIIGHMIAKKCFINSCHPLTKVTSLHRAVSMMDLKMVKFLIKKRANVDLKDHKGMLPIAHYGSYTPGEFQNPEIIKILVSKSSLLKDFQRPNTVIQFKRAFECGTRKVIRMLLEYCTNMLHIKDKEGQTPLHYLVGNYHSDITEELQGLEFDVNVCDKYGRTPLFIASRYHYSHVNTIQFLLQKGADVNAVTSNLNVALFVLCANPVRSEEEYCHIIEMFLQYDLDISFVGLNQKTVFDVIILMEKFYMAKPLLAHLAILEEQGNSVSEHIRYKIDSNQIFKNYFDSCQRELAELKNNSTDQRLTLYMILFTPKEKILQMCRYNTNSLFELENLIKECCSYNIYCKTIKKIICSIVNKIELYQSAALIMCKLLKLQNNVNHLVVAEIMNYLGDQDLQTLVKIII